MSEECHRCGIKFDERWRMVRHLRDNVACRKFHERLMKTIGKVMARSREKVR